MSPFPLCFFEPLLITCPSPVKLFQFGDLFPCKLGPFISLSSPFFLSDTALFCGNVFLPPCLDFPKWSSPPFLAVDDLTLSPNSNFPFPLENEPPFSPFSSRLTFRGVSGPLSLHILLEDRYPALFGCEEDFRQTLEAFSLFSGHCTLP